MTVIEQVHCSISHSAELGVKTVRDASGKPAHNGKEVRAWPTGRLGDILRRIAARRLVRVHCAALAIALAGHLRRDTYRCFWTHPTLVVHMLLFVCVCVCALSGCMTVSVCVCACVCMQRVRVCAACLCVCVCARARVCVCVSVCACVYCVHACLLQVDHRIRLPVTVKVDGNKVVYEWDDGAYE